MSKRATNHGDIISTSACVARLARPAHSRIFSVLRTMRQPTNGGRIGTGNDASAGAARLLQQNELRQFRYIRATRRIEFPGMMRLADADPFFRRVNDMGRFQTVLAARERRKARRYTVEVQGHVKVEDEVADRVDRDRKWRNVGRFHADRFAPLPRCAPRQGWHQAWRRILRAMVSDPLTGKLDC